MSDLWNLPNEFDDGPESRSGCFHTSHQAFPGSTPEKERCDGGGFRLSGFGEMFLDRLCGEISESAPADRLISRDGTSTNTRFHVTLSNIGH